MQNEVNSHVKELQTIGNTLNSIKERFNNDSLYQTDFQNAIKKEAENFFQQGVNIGDLNDYIDNRINKIMSLSEKINLYSVEQNNIPNEKSTPNDDFEKISKIENLLININEKSERNEEFKNLFDEHSFISINNIKQTITLIPDEIKQKYLDEFNQLQGDKYPIFQIDIQAKKDLELFEKGELSSYEIQRKIDEKSDYKKSIILIIEENIPSYFIANKDTFVKTKLNEIKESVNSMTDEQKEKHKEEFDKKYPNGFKLSKEIEKENSSILENELDDYKNNIYYYLKSEQLDDYKRIERVQETMDLYLKNPEKFMMISERFFDDGLAKKSLPTPKFTALKDSKHFSQELHSKLINQTKIIVKNAQNLGDFAKKSVEQLKVFRMNQFKQGNTEVKKQIAHKESLHKRHTKNYSMSI